MKFQPIAASLQYVCNHVFILEATGDKKSTLEETRKPSHNRTSVSQDQLDSPTWPDDYQVIEQGQRWNIRD